MRAANDVADRLGRSESDATGVDPTRSDHGCATGDGPGRAAHRGPAHLDPRDGRAAGAARRGCRPPAYWSVGAIGALLFLGSLLAHEIAHSVVARRNDVEVQGITLWMFGGYAQFENDPPRPGRRVPHHRRRPGHQPGPGGGVRRRRRGARRRSVLPQLYVSLMAWLAFINGFLGVFNLLPGAPLDGGRILAAALWKLRGDRVAGHMGAATAGKFVGLGLIGIGVFESLVASAASAASGRC